MANKPSKAEAFLATGCIVWAMALGLLACAALTAGLVRLVLWLVGA